MYRGYIKLWRKSFDSIIWKNPKLWRFWTWCLMKATHRQFKGSVSFSEIDLAPGEFIFGRKKCSKETGLSERTIRTCISKLNGNKIVVKSTNRYSIINIINWELYQQPENENDQQTTSKRPANDQQTTTYKNVKNEKNEKNVKKKEPPCPHLKIIDIYHKKLPMLPIVQSHTEDLKSRIRARWREDPKRQTLEWWEWYFEGVLGCDFLIGKVKDWAASFYWLVGPKNMTKVLNGEYVNRETQTKTDQAIKGFLNGQ